jgi:hypothetical protein
MAHSNPYMTVSERIQRVIAAVDLAEVPREDIDAFLGAIQPEPLSEETARRIYQQASRASGPDRDGKPAQGRNGARTSAQVRNYRLTCEQLEDRLPPSAFLFSLGSRSFDSIRDSATALPTPAPIEAERAVAAPMVHMCAGEMPAVYGGEYGLAAATEPHTALSVECCSSVFARSDYQLGAGFDGPGAPGPDLQDVLAWNLLSSGTAAPGVEAYSLQMAT